MKLDIYNSAGNKTKSSVDVAEAVFGIEPNEHCVYLAIKSEMASLHQGTHQSKNRSAVSENSPQAIIYNDVITFANERGKSLDPFQIREYKDIYPLEYKQTIATAKALDNIKNLEFNLSFASSLK